MVTPTVVCAFVTSESASPQERGGALRITVSSTLKKSVSEFFAFLTRSWIVDRDPAHILARRLGCERMVQSITADGTRSSDPGEMSGSGLGSQGLSRLARAIVRAPEKSKNSKGAEISCRRSDSLYPRARQKHPIRSDDESRVNTAEITAITECERALNQSGLRKVIKINLHDRGGFYLGIAWSRDDRSGHWRIMHENAWEIRGIAHETSEYVWVRKREVRPLSECRPFQIHTARPYLVVLLKNAAVAMKVSSLLNTRRKEARV